MRLFLRKRVLIGATISLLIVYLLSASIERPAFWDSERQLLTDRRQSVEDARGHAWYGYTTQCMSHDSLHPVSNTCGGDFRGWGDSATDALSTAIRHCHADNAIHY